MISLQYDPWDFKTDLLMERPGGDVGFTLVHDAVEVEDVKDRVRRRSDKLAGQGVDEVAGLLAGCLEWLRFHNLTAEEVQVKVREALRKDRERLGRQALVEAQRSIHVVE